MNEALDVMTRTLYGEAESWNKEDAIAIANVIMNRVRLPHWPDNPKAVCLQPWQFSCWNIGDANRARIVNAGANDLWFAQCQHFARTALNGTLPDPTQRSTHYYATYVKAPHWAKGKQPVYQVAHKKGSTHLFFNDIDTPPPLTAQDALEQVTPLHRTRTVKAGQVATASTLGTISIETIQDITAPATQQVMQVLPYMDAAKWLLLALILISVLAMIWARLDDRKRGLR
jgi:hypothetical protein